MIKNRLILLLICIVLAGVGVVQLNAQQPRFYISTDKIFGPGEEATVTIETRGLEFIDMRVYRLDDPVLFFLVQSDSHQPHEDNALAGPNVVTILRSVIDTDQPELRSFLRRFFTYRFRADMVQQNNDLSNVAVPGQKKSINASVETLGKYPLVRHFRFNLVTDPKQEFDEGANEWKYEKIPIYENEPGVYLVEGVNGTHAGYTLVVISKVALITKQSGTKLLCYLADKISAQPIMDASLTVIDTQTRKQVAAGKTDKQGLFAADIKNKAHITVIARKDNQLAIIDPTFFPVSINHRKVYIYTDRPVYRPSQEVFFKGIARDVQGETYKTLMNMPVNVKLMDPLGNEIKKMSTTLNDVGSFYGSFTLSSEPAIGTYKVIAEIDGKPHQGEFKVKAYKKPLFKVDLSLKGSGLKENKVLASVSCKYYSGIPVKDANVSYYVFRTRFYIPWWINENYSWYYSESEYHRTNEEQVDNGTGKLDSKGKFTFSFETKNEDKDYTYRVEVRVLDKTDYTAVGEASIRTSSAQYEVAIRTDRLVYPSNGNIVVSFFTHDIYNKPVKTGFEFNAVKVTAGNEKDNKGKAGPGEKEVFKKHVETDASGKATVTFSVKESGYIVLNTKGLDSFNNIITNSTSIWVSSPGEAVSYGGEGIEIVIDRWSYRPDETAKILVLSRIPNIPFLFTIEGGEIYNYKVERFKGNACMMDVPLKSLYSPNVYLQAAAIFDDHFYLGKKNVIIPPVDKLLNVSLKTDKEVYRPRDTVTVDVQITDYKGRAVQAELSLGVVDEAIYAVSPELAVAMQKFFYPRKQNAVRTFNSLTFNFYGYSQEVKSDLARLEMRNESGLSSFKDSKKSTRRIFKDTCFWTPAVMTNKEGKATITFQLPDNITQWRLTARCINYFTQVGTGSGKFISRTDFFIVMDPPLSFTRGDTVEIPVIIQNRTDKTVSGQLQFDLDGGDIVGDYDKAFTIKPHDNAEITVITKINGRKEIKITAGAKAGNLKDSIEAVVPITPYGVENSLHSGTTLNSGVKQGILKFNLADEAIRDYHDASLYIHTGIYRALLDSLNYLAQYPYGCVEQTLSCFLPDLVLDHVLKNQKIENKLLKEEAKKFIDAGISRLIRYQDPGHNGWGWWGEDTGIDPSMTAYVMYGLTIAKNLGYYVPEESYSKGLDALEKSLEKVTQGHDTTRTLALYALALAKRPIRSMNDDLYNKRASLPTINLAELALTLWESGNKTGAKALGDLILKQKTSGKLAAKTYWEGGETADMVFQLPEAATAMAIRALLKTHTNAPEIESAISWLLDRRIGMAWESTLDTALVVSALSDYLDARGMNLAENEKDQVRIRVNKKEWQTVPTSILHSDNGNSFITIKKADLIKGENTLEIERETTGPLYANLWLSYYSSRKDVKTVSGPLLIDRQYIQVTKQPDSQVLIAQPFTDPSNIRFKPGEEFLVKLMVTNTQPFEYMILEDFIPAGFQIIEDARGYNFRDNSINQNLEHRFVTYKEARDNRMVFAFKELPKNGRLTIYYLMRASLKGNYEVNPAVIRSMYLNHQRALSDRLSIKVKDAKEKVTQ